MAIAYVALGSNLGDKKKNLQRALMLLMQQGVEVLQVSGYFATEPYGVTDQPQFLNAVCRVRTGACGAFAYTFGNGAGDGACAPASLGRAQY